MSADAVSTAFEPSRYLTKLSNKDYLEVKWRLVWFRSEHPHGAITTEDVQITDKLAVFKATVTDSEGGSATGFGSETPGDFRDFIEKAETKAIGRALSALGYGTPFAPDFEEGTEPSGQRNIVDSPVDISRTHGWAGDRATTATTTASPATERQVTFLQNVARAAGLDEAGLRQEIRAMTGGTRLELTRREASQLIDRLKTLSTDLPVADSPHAHEQAMPAANGNGNGNGTADRTRRISQIWATAHAITAKDRELADQLVHAGTRSKYEKAGLRELTVEELDHFAEYLTGPAEAIIADLMQSSEDAG